VRLSIVLFPQRVNNFGKTTKRRPVRGQGPRVSVSSLFPIQRHLDAASTVSITQAAATQCKGPEFK
jgi:hypothetical protein